MPEVSLLPSPSEPSNGLTPQLMQVPVMAQALFFLREAHPAKGIKLTVDQCISKSFVQKFWTAQIQPFYPNSRKPMKHEDTMELTRSGYSLPVFTAYQYEGSEVVARAFTSLVARQSRRGRV